MLFQNPTNKNNPGISFSSVNCIASYIKRVFSPRYRPEMKPDWVSRISLGSTVFSRLAIAPEAILYTQFNREIGL